MDFKIQRDGKGMTNSSGTSLPSQRLASGERQSLSLIPGSIDDYVTEVSERSQQSCNLKDDDKHDKSPRIQWREHCEFCGGIWGIMVRAAKKPNGIMLAFPKE
ncbi:hypothetical protein FE392_15275 [Xenorhabdus sp. 12]|uniref:Uncharacterized protein n=1 Tax=Xenorhabdus santafensis TaxID=2582833 RepID=A0ABU4SD02_9GAMM|nr:hypothetical protein [Xenorhabdus sp. 12]MDX7988675.1 hypothetical protein [Xenorhabdus sp. 12]